MLNVLYNSIRSLKNRLPISVSALGLTLLKDRQDDVLDIVLSVSLKQTRSYKLEIEHKSLILAQIERWRHAYTCKSDGSTEKLASWVASGERVSNISERTE